MPKRFTDCITVRNRRRVAGPGKDNARRIPCDVGECCKQFVRLAFERIKVAGIQHVKQLGRVVFVTGHKLTALHGVFTGCKGFFAFCQGVRCLFRRGLAAFACKPVRYNAVDFFLGKCLAPCSRRGCVDLLGLRFGCVLLGAWGPCVVFVVLSM